MGKGEVRDLTGGRQQCLYGESSEIPPRSPRISVRSCGTRDNANESHLGQRFIIYKVPPSPPAPMFFVIFLWRRKADHLKEG